MSEQNCSLIHRYSTTCASFHARNNTDAHRVGPYLGGVDPRRIKTMYRLLTLTAVTVLATGALVQNRVEASPLSASMGAKSAIEALSPTENVALCFYADGWNGPGLYEC